MYVRSSHRPRSIAEVLEVIERYRFGTLVTNTADGLIATHLPFMIDPARGEHGTLLAHMARANPQSAAIGDDGEALVTFLGPHGYISPSWYDDRATAPTWDYVAVHCYGRTVRHSDEEALRNIERLIGIMEAPPPAGWSTADLSEEQVQSLIRNVVSFEMPLSRIEGKFKLNQGDKPERIRAAVARLGEQGEHELSAYMERFNDL
jgi:transcriptional regulator